MAGNPSWPDAKSAAPAPFPPPTRLAPCQGREERERMPHQKEPLSGHAIQYLLLCVCSMERQLFNKVSFPSLNESSQFCRNPFYFIYLFSYF
ncbi:hypothetical protein CEXT_747641 [Caerostris extrusa]|uniref:Uncharacterized protein n=1 Tax=Caerostris extrusa TaxID=172846 RepID=A0AAV4TB51_CAEEX|nr:hypothetical protein CEXT_747641 [Caerostris extrusa]